MAVYKLKETPTVDALPLPDGKGYVVIENGVPVTKTVAEFEAKYVAVPLQQG